jgi:hypothetical protein
MNDKVIMPDGFMAKFYEMGKVKKLTLGEKRKLRRATKRQDEDLMNKISMAIIVENFAKTCAALELDLDDSVATALIKEVLIQDNMNHGMTEIEARQISAEHNIKLTRSDKSEVKIRDTPIMENDDDR